MDSLHEVDVAIVGMGPAGLYAAWRLAECDPDRTVLGKPVRSLQVGLYDTMKEHRVGGRLCTQPLPGYPFLAELGGMRYRSTQRLVTALIDTLGLSDDAEPFDFPQQFYFLRGKRLTPAEMRPSEHEKVPYDLGANEKGRLPEELIQDAIQRSLEHLAFSPRFYRSREANEWGVNPEALLEKLRATTDLSALTPREWAILKRFGEYRGISELSDTGFWDLLQFNLSAEGWHLAHDGLGYESIMGNWNAAIALPWFLSDFSPSKAQTLRNGMSSLPRALYSRLAARTNFRCRHEWDLTGVQLAQNDKGAEELLELLFTDGKLKTQRVRAKAVILALPKGALIRLRYSDDLIDRVPAPERLEKRAWYFDLLNSVDSRALFKLFLGYNTPWWAKGKPAYATGKANTDLPLRQIYYYGKDRWNHSRANKLGVVDGKDQRSMVMASYSDSHYIEFWSEANRPSDWAYCGRKGGAEALPEEDRSVLREFGASRTMILRAEHQLGLLHGLPTLQQREQPLAEVGLYMEWSRPPYYAGWHSWKVGIEPWNIIGAITRPFNGTPLYICGEAYSEEQGWTEGALKSAERLLTSEFQLPLPEAIKGKFFNGQDKELLDYLDILDSRSHLLRARSAT